MGYVVLSAQSPIQSFTFTFAKVYTRKDTLSEASLDIVLAMSIFFIVVTMIFVTIALLLPEWMGITGKRAKKIIEMQRQEEIKTEQQKTASPKETHQEDASAPKDESKKDI